MGNSESLKPSPLTGHGRTETQAWRHAEIHEHGLVIKRLTEGNPHGFMAGIFIIQAKAGNSYRKPGIERVLAAYRHGQR